ncbi:MAG: hypothetical protein F6J90_25075 [Moorea sp. SIOASIH]|uniref:hypothetical protein n=1 Tax=Moorena sp. SIOASIH TaxID=2607817 RepID=UPI0013BD07A7|nr:hypothetical protein [Moorena sp. SIOASIH]NEO39425.1 hypothetical protein [Moorena sp. SIOASIH]
MLKIIQHTTQQQLCFFLLPGARPRYANVEPRIPRHKGRGECQALLLEKIQAVLLLSEFDYEGEGVFLQPY